MNILSTLSKDREQLTVHLLITDETNGEKSEANEAWLT
jgi:hypothetical protein